MVGNGWKLLKVGSCGGTGTRTTPLHSSSPLSLLIYKNKYVIIYIENEKEIITNEY